MDRPSWNDTLRAAVSSCCASIPCFPRRSSPADDADGQQHYAPLGPDWSIAARRARADELEGLLRDEDRHHGDGADIDAAADADAISLHSHLGPRGRARVPPRTPRHISLWGWNLFGVGRKPASGGVQLPAGSADPLHRAEGSVRRRDSEESTAALLSRAAMDPTPETLTEDQVERRARRKARKEMKRLARALRESGASSNQLLFDADESPAASPDPRDLSHQFMPTPQMVPHVDEDPEGEADLDGAVYARAAPRASLNGSQSRSSGRSSTSGSGSIPYSPSPLSGFARHSLQPPPPKARKTKSKKSKSSATSSTLGPESPTFGAFVAAPSKTFDGTPGEFDGTPGGLDDGFDGTPGSLASPDGTPVLPWEAFPREAMPSPGLSRPANRARSSSGAFLANMS
ncbi:unnamed protein product [Mycena citricolor]|uniref:Uncharacterized protein n=1 Tax=Mycena citricolor TaxID=2018698 RepID=A0AAD2H728_9AGAR|nr:unnamed protein product [Mycena citricolor]